MTEALYRRVVSPSGRVRYVETGVSDADVYPIGAHLVVVEPGLRTTRYRIDPATAPLLAAAEVAREPMLVAMRERISRVEVQPDTEAHRRGWAAYLAAGGPPSGLSLRGASMAEVVDAGIDALIRAALEVP